MMGAIAARGADVVIVTDDNPRSEEPAAIRAAILAAAPGAREIGDRARGDPRGRRHAGRRRRAGGRRQGSRNRPDRRRPDAAVLRRRVGARGAGGGAHERRFWTAARTDRARSGAPSAPLASAVTGVSIDTRTLAARRPVRRHRGDAHDGHDYVARALRGRRGGGGRRRAPARANCSRMGRVFVRRRHACARMERLGAAARARSRGARSLAVTGSVGKTSAKEMLRSRSPQRAHARLGRLLQQPWGVPLTLARMPRGRRLRRVRDRHEPCRRDHAAGRHGAPAVALITTIAPVHIEHLGSLEAIADAKAEIFSGLEPGGVAVLNRDAPQFERLAATRARAAGASVRTFGAGAGCDARLIDVEPRAEGSSCARAVYGREHRLHARRAGPAHGRERARRAAVVEALGASVEAAAAALGRLRAGKGRGERFALQASERRLHADRRELQRQPGLDARGARAAGRDEARAGRPAHRGDRRHAGARRRRRRRCTPRSRRNSPPTHVDLLFGAGPLMRSALRAASAGAARRAWRSALADICRRARLAAVRAGDVVMIKGSNGSRMGPLVSARCANISRAMRA